MLKGCVLCFTPVPTWWDCRLNKRINVVNLASGSFHITKHDRPFGCADTFLWLHSEKFWDHPCRKAWIFLPLLMRKKKKKRVINTKSIVNTVQPAYYLISLWKVASWFAKAEKLCVIEVRKLFTCLCFQDFHNRQVLLQ